MAVPGTITGKIEIKELDREALNSLLATTEVTPLTPREKFQRLVEHIRGLQWRRQFQQTLDRFDREQAELNQALKFGKVKITVNRFPATDTDKMFYLGEANNVAITFKA